LWWLDRKSLPRDARAVPNHDSPLPKPTLQYVRYITALPAAMGVAHAYSASG